MNRAGTDPSGVGLCARCRHARTVITRTSTFWMCERSKTDPRYEKYPRLPVVACPGFEPSQGGPGEANDPQHQTPG